MRKLLHRWAMRRFDADAIRAAIEAAERGTSAEIRVSIAPLVVGNVETVARKAFDRLGMGNTHERNGVLIFVVPMRHRFHVLGDEGIHAKAGQELWDRAAALMQADFRRGDFTAGLVAGINEIGQALAQHFPAEGEHAVNELPNEVDLH